MGKHPVELYYDECRALAEASLDPTQADYLALSQGEYGTKLRHEAVLTLTSGLTRQVLDLGCGTGLLLDKMIEHGIRPGRYDGVDGMPEREAPFTRRLKEHGVDGVFRHKPMDIRFEEISYGMYDAALLVGVMGFWGYHTQAHVKSIFAKMKRIADHGCITFPMIYSPLSMGDLHVRRWDVNDVKDALGPIGHKLEVLEREFVVFW